MQPIVIGAQRRWQYTRDQVKGENLEAIFTIACARGRPGRGVRLRALRAVRPFGRRRHGASQPLSAVPLEPPPGPSAGRSALAVPRPDGAHRGVGAAERRMVGGASLSSVQRRPHESDRGRRQRSGPDVVGRPAAGKAGVSTGSAISGKARFGSMTDGRSKSVCPFGRKGGVW